jgi:hypothetical protein
LSDAQLFFCTMRPTRAASAAAALAALFTLVVSVASPIAAQDSTAASANTRSDSTTRPKIRFEKYRQYPWNGVSVWAGSAYETRSASHNENIVGGSMRVLGLQISRDVWRGERTRIAYVGEVLPVMLVRSGPPAKRMPDTARFSYPRAELDRFRYRDAFGIGFAPLGAEVTYQTSRRTSALFNVTAGGLLFTKIVPYGRGTQPNFTVSPGVALQWAAENRTLVALGYTFHHLSNASFGDSNPGMNSQIIYLRVSRLRKESALR